MGGLVLQEIEELASPKGRECVDVIVQGIAGRCMWMQGMIGCRCCIYHGSIGCGCCREGLAHVPRQTQSSYDKGRIMRKSSLKPRHPIILYSALPADPNNNNNNNNNTK